MRGLSCKARDTVDAVVSSALAMSYMVTLVTIIDFEPQIYDFFSIQETINWLTE